MKKGEKKNYKTIIIVSAIILAIVLVFAFVNFLYNQSEQDSWLGNKLRSSGVFSDSVSLGPTPTDPCKGVKCPCSYCKDGACAPSTNPCCGVKCDPIKVCDPVIGSSPTEPNCRMVNQKCCYGTCIREDQVCCHKDDVTQICENGESCCEGRNKDGKVISIDCYIPSSCADCCEGIVYDPKEFKCCTNQDTHAASLCSRSTCPTCIKDRCVNECDWMPCYECQASYEFDSTGTATTLRYGCMDTCEVFPFKKCESRSNPDGEILPPGPRGPIDWDPNTKGPVIDTCVDHSPGNLEFAFCEKTKAAFKCCYKFSGLKEVCDYESMVNIVTLKKCKPPYEDPDE